MGRAQKPAGTRTNSGRKLNERWNIGAAHALYHREGTWFNLLEWFPGALCDPNGYVLFSSKSEYENSPDVHIGQQTNVPAGIHRMGGYTRMTK